MNNTWMDRPPERKTSCLRCVNSNHWKICKYLQKIYLEIYVRSNGLIFLVHVTRIVPANFVDGICGLFVYCLQLN